MIFWLSAGQIAAKMERLRLSEAKLMSLSKQGNHDFEVSAIDTKIPRSSVPLQSHGYDVYPDEEEDYIIHGIQVKSNNNKSQQQQQSSTPPLVILHGYMNGGIYFYRMFESLSRHFDTIYSLDWLGWGLSSRPKFVLPSSSSNDDVNATENVFVESLEAWRQQQGLDKMVLVGHSMGGYLTVAYTERYPQYVQRLILLSPVGVPEQEDDEAARKAQEERRRTNWSLQRKMLFGVYKYMFDNYYSPGDVLRALPSNRARDKVLEYVNVRLKKSLSNIEERQALADYLFDSNTLPGSGEYGLNRLLNSSVFARKPLQHRIPNLVQVESVTFLYGAQDWMDIRGGLACQKTSCAAAADQNDGGDDDSTHRRPLIDVYTVSNAGHLLQLENPQEVSAGILLATRQETDDLPVPTKVHYLDKRGEEEAQQPQSIGKAISNVTGGKQEKKKKTRRSKWSRSKDDDKQQQQQQQVEVATAAS